MRSRDIATAGETRKLEQLTKQVRQLSPERQEALLADIDSRALFDSDPTLQTVTLEQIANAYKVSVRSLLRYIASGDLQAVRIGRGYRVTQEQVRAWLQRRTVRK